LLQQGNILFTLSEEPFVTWKNAQGQLELGINETLNWWMTIETDGRAWKAMYTK
jgi:hypothetical protein